MRRTILTLAAAFAPAALTAQQQPPSQPPRTPPDTVRRDTTRAPAPGDTARRDTTRAPRDTTKRPPPRR